MNWDLLRYLLPFEASGDRRFKVALWVMVPAVAFGLLWLSADTEFGRAAGLAESKMRLASAGRAAYWAVRAARGSEDEKEKGFTYRGYLDKAQGDLMLAYLYRGNGRQRIILRLANVQEGTVNVEHFVETYRGQALRFDLFALPTERYPRAVVWKVDVPLNLEVIMKAGGAERNPPTNVVDWMFAKYYWRLACNGI
ncbi:hypothetical protein LDZ95_34725 [Pseudomonas aeruginosa]|nr:MULTISPECIES: hypothetical protein [Pseudomonas aeruginosa group]EIU1445520.1 hypothetical protein [Pseudomonas aeruginosa]EJH4818824.1 hypothetical protein [Pseudomonas aeruginosa]EKL8566425.1 hypothetical protein [Pseudomonas aeruginosa]EKS3059547.1 hypothetical protein [Pseudomonas aeruginosa]EKU4838786.1 hypothetical protein [Pseudomonas aeruginosa]